MLKLNRRHVIQYHEWSASHAFSTSACMQSITLGWAKGVVQAALETRQGAFTDILLTFVFSFRNTDSNHVEHFRNDDRTINL